MESIEGDRRQALTALEALAERAPAVADVLARLPAPIRDSAPRVLAASEFVLDALARDPDLIGLLSNRAEPQFAGLSIEPPAVSGLSEEAFMAALRRWRRAEFVRIAWRDLAGWADLNETLTDLSNAADTALRLATHVAAEALYERYGRPRDGDGALQELIVVAMGKLGGRELNFSSDIDLVLLFPSSGETDGRRAIDNQEFFTRLGQALFRLLEQSTVDGFVFRMDLRLRPFGDSGPLVSSAAALEDYLQIHGRDWERYAWIKARPVTNADGYDAIFKQCIQPFVYRRYLDFGVFESLREMKALIERDIQRRELANNIKLGDGGIREVEFIVQSFQLIRGGQDRRLQQTSLRGALALLAGAKLLPASAVCELDQAYVFLRRVENRLQMRADAQTHVLPTALPDYERLAAAMDCESAAALQTRLDAQRRLVAGHFREVVFGSSADADQNQVAPLALERSDRASLTARLQQTGYGDEAQTAAQLLVDFRDLAFVRRLDAIGSRRLDALLPVLVGEAGTAREPLPALRRLLRVVEAIGVRSAYFALLLHNPRARSRLVQLAERGDLLMEQIAAHPLLLDELIDERVFDSPPDRAALSADLQQRMAGIDVADGEHAVEQLRHFQRAAVFRLGVADLLARLPVMQVSDRLTDVAELIVEQAIALTWQQLTPQLGTPMCGEAGSLRPVNICAVGYGKMGGLELSYSSDLDLVFLHDSAGSSQETQGTRSIENQVFFVRFVQRLVHLLTMHSAAGRLYEVDMRLRPSGKGGMMITSIDAFADYQRREAWTWEHQALLHARSVAGAPALRDRFEALRIDLLAHHVRRDTLREEVRSMRNRMRRELSRAGQGQFDMKQDPGGIADIEFLAQYWALWWAKDYPPVAMFPDTIRQLESVASANLVPQELIDVLTGTYRRYRTCLHHRALQGAGAVVDRVEWTADCRAVTEVWDSVMGA
ncbi:MAG TPA: bifunctional [glutamate--ammonia ligase]-adenylyl-L-tyrosine phosphorylase/[glutamate--ammonia-ligase] adenylyltransferase [Steroidobacteraceae bacterium]|jgi:glutamate-ammonia-ligase adenylyltransferase|nr:bifunctional [glutamate--ammonia ligase]-adenylyl-L-tyrosine phosphorylase/[glutamate--ammonia-ligase] adenylyltransferase [Steroidobacteraceae bacterium]